MEKRPDEVLQKVLGTLGVKEEEKLGDAVIEAQGKWKETIDTPSIHDLVREAEAGFEDQLMTLEGVLVGFFTVGYLLGKGVDNHE